jgi:hypothetical protein
METGKITQLTDENLEDFKYGLVWSPNGKWIAFGPENAVKVRPESTIWEADFDELLNKLAI